MRRHPWDDDEDDTDVGAVVSAPASSSHEGMRERPALARSGTQVHSWDDDVREESVEKSGMEATDAVDEGPPSGESDWEA